MPPIHSIQPSFTAGELSPALYGRVDFAKYASGLKTARNGILHPTGGFSNRPGFLYVAPVKYSGINNSPVRLVTFEFSDSQVYMLEFGYQYIRFYRDRAQIQSVGVPYTINSPYGVDDIPLLKFTQSANVLYIAVGSQRPKTLTRITDTSWTLADFNFLNGPYMPDNSTTTTIAVTQPGGYPFVLTSSAPIFDPSLLDSWFRVTERVRNQSISGTLVNGSTSTGIRSYKTWRISTIGTWTGSVQIQADTDPGFGSAITIATLSSSNDANYNTFGNIPYDYPVYIRVLGSLSGTDSVTYTLSSDDFAFDHNYQGTYISPTQFGANEPSIAFTHYSIPSTTEWAEGSWSDFRGWPAVVGFYQDRLCWASTLAQPVTLFMSQTGDYPNYGISDPLVDSDAISANLNSRRINIVQNLLSMIRLVPITTSAEFSVGPGATGVLAPTSIDLKNQGYRGGSSVQAIVIGNMAVYVQPMGTVVRSIGYQIYTDTFSGENLSLLSDHLFKRFKIVDAAYQQEPDSIAWFVRNDGTLLSMTFMPEQQITGWTRNDTQGTFESVASIPNLDGGYDEIWAVVNRPNGRFVECLSQRLPTTDVKDAIHLDCSISYSGSPATVISGLDHLEGMSVMTLADGIPQGPFTVASGQITLDTAASIVHVGLSYTFDFETLNFESQAQDGTQQGRRQRVAQATMRFKDTVGGYIGSDSSHLHKIIQQPGPVLSSPPTLYSGDYRIPITSSWADNGRVFYRQVDPLPVTILAIMPVVETSDL